MSPYREPTALGPLRIALISEHASPLALMGGVDAGGQNVYVNHVARCLGMMGHQVDVYTRQDDPDLPPTVAMAPGVAVHHVVAGPKQFVPKEQLLPYMFEFAMRMRQAMSSHTYDLMHANFFMSGLAALRIKAATHLPLVMTFHALGLVRRQHQPESDAFPAERIDIERLLLDEADVVVAECPQDESDLVQLYGADRSRLTIVPCGIDTAEIHPMPQAQARAQLGLRPDEFIILQLGRMVPRKGIDNVIRALSHLPSHMNARLIVVGGDSREPDPLRTPEIARLMEVARHCGVSDRVQFTGHRQRRELRAYYGAADVFVTTPWYEPFGITPLEAMASGLPVIGARVGGIQHSVVDRVTGLLVPPKDAAALASALCQIKRDPARARQMGQAGLRRVHDQFTWHRVAAQLEAVYRSVLPSEWPVPVAALSSMAPSGPRALASLPEPRTLIARPRASV